jgi:hypothetical protein
MYAFRKAFAAGTYDNSTFWHVNYKVWLVIAQVVGYTASKFYGIRFIAETGRHTRGKSILTLIGISWLALLGFALVPAPWNIVFLLINGFPLGMIWGLVCGYLEGRRNTEFMAAVMSTSLIFASGFVKSTARMLMTYASINEYWMPFLTGLIFVLPLVLFVYCLEIIPPPSEKDRQSRSVREPMNATERRQFVKYFLPGIVLTLIIYVSLTIMRDVRDNFEVEIWANYGVHDYGIYTKIDSIIALVVLVLISSLMLVRNNLRAFTLIHYMIIAGCLLIAIATILFSAHKMDVTTWMMLAGLGLYLGYIPYNAIFFERMLATFRYKGNVGFVMYIADAIGYLGSVSILFVKEFGNASLSWGYFFQQSVLVVGFTGGAVTIISLLYFRTKKVRSGVSDIESLPAASVIA